MTISSADRHRARPPSPGIVSARTLSLWGPVAGTMAAIFVLSSMPSVPGPGFPHADKVGHVGLYAVLTWFVVRALGDGDVRRAGPGEWAAAAVLAIAYGATDEMHQAFVPGRVASWADLGADAIGAALTAVARGAWSIIGRSGRHRV